MKVEISLIDANPHRNFKHYPLDPEQVSRLEQSFTELRQYDALPARKVGNRYQIACGHHRLEAMRNLNFKTVELNIGPRTEDDMIKIMILENATQRGHNEAAMFDSVSAVTERVAYELLRWDTWEDFQAQSPMFTNETVKSKRSWETARNMLMAGQGVGREIIRAYAGTEIISDREAKRGIAALKDSGVLEDLISAVQTVIDAEIEAIKAEAERKRQAAIEEERLAKEKAEREAEAARKRAANAEARKKAEAERKRKIAEAEAKAEEKRKIAEAEAARARKLREAKARAAKAEREAEAARVKKVGGKVEMAAITLFKKGTHGEAFRQAMIETGAADIIAPEAHVEVAQEIIDWHKERGRELTAWGVKHRLSSHIRDGKRVQIEALHKMEQERRDQVQANIERSKNEDWYKKNEREMALSNELKRYEDDFARKVRELGRSADDYFAFVKRNKASMKEFNSGTIRSEIFQVMKVLKNLFAFLKPIDKTSEMFNTFRDQEADEVFDIGDENTIEM